MTSRRSLYFMRILYGNQGHLLSSTSVSYAGLHQSGRGSRLMSTASNSRENDPRWKGVDLTRYADECDILIVGGGPSGFAAAIRAKQLETSLGKELRVCLLEKGAEPGAHTLSGACISARAMDELIPDWKDKGCPIRQKVTKEKMLVLVGEKASIPVPILPLSTFPLQNRGCYIVRMGHVVKWMAEQAESLGVEIFPGFAGSEVLYHEDGSVKGVATNDVGIAKDGSPKPTFERGMELHAKVTIFAEGCRGHLTKSLIEKFDLRKNSNPSAYAIGFKELWELDPKNHVPGLVIHSTGYPLPYNLYGGSFMYHMDDNGQKICQLGLIVALDYSNPHINPYEEFQKYKRHPIVSKYLKGATRLGYGARAIDEGGFQSLPKVVFPGGCLAGCTAGFLNVPQIKGVHYAMKTGMLASEAAVEAIKNEATTKTKGLTATSYEGGLQRSWVWKDLRMARNVRPSFATPLGLFGGFAYTGLFYTLLQGKEPWTFSHGAGDHTHLKPAKDSKVPTYRKPDGELTFDLLTSVSLSGTDHEEDQPCHLTLADTDIPQTVNWTNFKGPESRYCPAGVYEYVQGEDGVNRLEMSPSNCLHCKTCDIKDPTQNIHWVSPEGGGGPKYEGM